MMTRDDAKADFILHESAMSNEGRIIALKECGKWLGRLVDDVTTP